MNKPTQQVKNIWEFLDGIKDRQAGVIQKTGNVSYHNGYCSKYKIVNKSWGKDK